MNINAEYFMIEDYITEEERVEILDSMLNNLDLDPRPHFQFVEIGRGDLVNKWDPKNKMLKIIQDGYVFFKNKYTMEGKFGINRAHGNLMHAGAILEAHVDDSLDYDFQKTYVGALFLNNDYEGGEYIFGTGETEISFKPKPRSIVYFPGHSTIHGVKTVLSGSRINILFIYYDALSDEVGEEIFIPV